MTKHIKPKHVIGLLAIIIGAIATFDVTIAPILRYLEIYIAILVIAMIILMDVYLTVDDTPSLDKIRDEQ